MNSDEVRRGPLGLGEWMRGPLLVQLGSMRSDDLFVVQTWQIISLSRSCLKSGPGQGQTGPGAQPTKSFLPTHGRQTNESVLSEACLSSSCLSVVPCIVAKRRQLEPRLFQCLQGHSHGFITPIRSSKSVQPLF